jgi:hypothetical protein
MAVHEQRHLDPPAVDMIVTASGWRDARNAGQRHISLLPGLHPAEEDDGHEIYLMRDDLQTEISALEAKGIRCSDVQEARWGLITKLRLPGGGSVGLYQPKHPTALALTSN